MLRLSRKGQDAPSQKREAAAAVHLAFQELEPVHLSFDLSIAPMLLDACDDGGVIAANSGGESLQLADA